MLAGVEPVHSSAANALGQGKYALALAGFPRWGAAKIHRVSSEMKMVAKSLLAAPRRTVGKHLI